MKPLVRRLLVVSSTQDEARRLVEGGEASAGHVVVADRQTAGRGRFGRAWLSPTGGLYATFVLEPLSIPSIRAGLALVETLAQLGLATTLKWPNDVLVDGKKLAGVLVETAGELLLVGIGVNLTTTPLSTAAAACDHGAPIDEDAFLFEVWERFERDRPTRDALAAYRSVCETLGRPVRIVLGEGRAPIEGVAEDVDEDGCLIVSTRAGRRSIFSGECLHLGPPRANAFDGPSEGG